MAEKNAIYDFAVVGAGIAGASVAAELSKSSNVIILEMEHAPGYHTTGRSAAMFVPGYGPEPIRALTRASADFFHNPTDGFTDVPLLTKREVLMIARDDQMGDLDAFVKDVGGEVDFMRLTQADLEERYPLLQEGYAVAGLLDQSGGEIDVSAFHQGYMNEFKAHGGELKLNTPVLAMKRQKDQWKIQTKAGDFQAKTIVNAAGAWADELGELAGAEAIGLQPKRRSALMVRPPEGLEIKHYPLTIDINEDFYLKPDAGLLLISPANEDPMEPCDVQPEEFDIAYCIDRIERAFQIKVHRPVRTWAGLRSFVPDKSPVVGYSGKVEGFFWLAGQGGYGFHSCPALSRCAAALALSNTMPEDLLQHGVVLQDILVDRLH